MFEKKFLMILGLLALVSVGVSMGISALFGGSGKPSGKAQARGASARPRTLLDEMNQAGPSQTMAPRQHQVGELIKDLQLRINEYKRKADRLTQREQRVAIVEQNLKNRTDELEKLRTQLIGPLTRLKDAMAELENAQTLVDKEERTKLTRIAASYERMEAAKGGGILSDMYLNGQKKDVAKILYFMSERGSAKLLAEMDQKNPATQQMISAELTTLMKTIREQG